MTPSNALNPQKKGLAASIVLTLLFIGGAVGLMMFQGAFRDTATTVFSIVTLAFISFIVFMIFFTGEVHKYRRIFFSSYALFFVVSFVWDLLATRGHMWLLDSESLYQEAPMCHFVTIMNILPMVFRGSVYFPTLIGNAITMTIASILSGLIFGRGFCAYACFYGGQEELCATIPKKKRWNLKVLPVFVKYLPFGLMAFIALFSLVTMTPAYCVWLCPFKATTEFFEVNSFIRVIQTFLFVALWLGLVIVLPLLTKKRTQCSTLCPMGAFFSLTGKVSLFRLRIDKERCDRCLRCTMVCPTFALSKEGVEKGKPDLTCSLCGACMAACPNGAIAYGLKGAPITSVRHPLKKDGVAPGAFRRFLADFWEPGSFFLLGIFYLSAFLGSQFFTNTMSRIFSLVTGGAQ